MIRLVTGVVGSGKTLHSVGWAVEALADGRTIYTNIELNHQAISDLIRRRYRVIIEPDQIREVDLIADPNWHDNIEWGVDGYPVMVLLDEIHLWFNARDWSKTQKLHGDMLSFLSQSRKADVDVVFIAQVAGQLEKQFRDQCEWEFYFRALKSIKIPVLGVLPFNKVIMVQRNKENDKAISRSIHGYDKSLFGCYQTKSFLDAKMRSAAENHVRIPRRNLKRVPLISTSHLYALLITALIVTSIYFLK